MKKPVIPTEVCYLLAVPLMSLGIALTEKSDLGMSMISAPAYLISLKTTLTFGTAEYCFQALLLAGMCLLIRRWRWTYLLSFVTAFIYGSLLDGFVLLLEGLPTALGWRILWFILGMGTISLSVSLFFRTYIPPAVYELFVSQVTDRLRLPVSRFKIAFDCSFLVLSAALSLLLFRGLRGIGVGTVIAAVGNGLLIGLLTKWEDRCFTFRDRFPWRDKLI